MSNRQRLDATDRAILHFLQEEGALPNATLANRVGLSPSACLSRTRRLREEAIIRQTVAIVDEKQVGLETVVFTFVTLSPHNRQMAEAFVQSIRNADWVLECHNVTGSWDYLLKVVAEDIASYRDFVLDELLDMPGVHKVETLVVLRTEKRSFSLPMGHLEQEPTDESAELP